MTLSYAIIMPVWNQLRITRNAVASYMAAAKHTGHKVAIIVIDNGSTEPGIQEYYQSVLGLVVHRNRENEGVSVAWNQGLRIALGLEAGAICLSNNDVEAERSIFTAVDRALSENPKSYTLPYMPCKLDDLRKRGHEYAAAGLGKYLPGRAGWCMFFPRAAVTEFYPVPECLKLWYSDDYIHDVLRVHGWQPLVAKGAIMWHYGSLSLFSYPGYVERIAKDREAYELLREHLLRKEA